MVVANNVVPTRTFASQPFIFDREDLGPPRGPAL